MKRFRQFTESLNTVQPWTWLRQWNGMWSGLWEAAFSVVGLGYVVTFLRSPDGTLDYWAVSFQLDSATKRAKNIDTWGRGANYDATGTGNEFAVFATVLDIIKTFATGPSHPDTLYFTADEPSRKRLYDRFVRLVDRGALPGWVVIDHTDGHYTLTRA